MSPDQVQAHMHRRLLRWICRASPGDREKFKEVSNRGADGRSKGILDGNEKRGEV